MLVSNHPQPFIVSLQSIDGPKQQPSNSKILTFTSFLSPRTQTLKPLRFATANALPSISTPPELTACKSGTETACPGLLILLYHHQEGLYYSQPGPATKSHFRDGSLDHILNQLLSVGFTGKPTLYRGYWRILTEIESVSGEGRKIGQRKTVEVQL